MTQELWKPIPEYEGRYSVSNLGRVKSLSRKSNRRFKDDHILLQQLSTNGYSIVSICKDNIEKKVKVHRLVATAFLGVNDLKMQVNHINAIKTDNRVENLEWVTPLQNIRHAVNLGIFRNRNRKKAA